MSKAKVASINLENLEFGTVLMRAIAHNLRMRILQFIADKGECNVNQIYSSLKLEQSITSQHLRILRVAGLVTTRRDGKFIFYKVDKHRLSNTVKHVKAYMDQIKEEDED